MSGMQNEGAWSDGAPQSNMRADQNLGGEHRSSYDLGAYPTMQDPRDAVVIDRRQSLPEMLTSKVSRLREFEGLRGYSVRATLAIKYVNYFLAILLFCGVTNFFVNGVRFASGGGVYMLFSTMIIAVTGSIASLFYIPLRKEIVEKVRHYIFGLMLPAGTVVAAILKVLQTWEYSNGGGVGSLLSMALPAIFLATIFLPSIVFVKEILGTRTLHRGSMDNEEHVNQITRWDGSQR
jgi:hypothetical protein